MKETLRIFPASGELGQVYTTQTGMKLANPEQDSCGWMQIMGSDRAKVQSKCISGHDPFYVWEFVEPEEKA